MKTTFLTVAAIVMLLASCSDVKTNDPGKSMSTAEKKSACDAACMPKGKTGEPVCKRSLPELQTRRETVIESLKKKVSAKKELRDGIAFKFPGDDAMIDELTEFIKTERSCCDFFTFSLSVSGDKSEAWLELTGPEGVKDFLNRGTGL